MTTKDNAVEALETEIKLNEEAIKKLNGIIAQKKFDREDTDMERAEKSEIGSKLTYLENLLNEIKAGKVVVSAPTIDEINEVSNNIATIRNIAIAGAATSAGLASIKGALRVASSKLQEKVKTT